MFENLLRFRNVVRVIKEGVASGLAASLCAVAVALLVLGGALGVHRFVLSPRGRQCRRVFAPQGLGEHLASLLRKLEDFFLGQ